MHSSTTLLCLVGLAMLWLAPFEDGHHKSTEQEAQPEKLGDLTVLGESLRPLRDHFNDNKDKHRFIAILSPT